MRDPRRAQTLTILMAACALAACSGGGSTSGTPVGGGGTDTGGGDTDTGGGGPVGGLTVTGGLEFTVQNTPVKIDYSGGVANVTMVHKKSTGITCVSGLEMSIAKADGSCELRLVFDVGVASEKDLIKAELHAVKAVKQAGTVLEVIPCKGWPGTDSATDEKVYELDAGKGSVKAGPVKSPESGQDSAVLKGQKLAPEGKIKLRNKGDSVTTDLSFVQVSGDIKSTGSAVASCGTTTGEKKCATGGEEGNKVDNLMKRKPGLFMCSAPGVEFDFGELCGNDAIWVTTYRRWSHKACGGCDDGKTCYRLEKPGTNTWTPTCANVTIDCAKGCGDGKVCVGGTCFAKVADGEDMSLKDELEGYAGIYVNATKGQKVAAVFAVIEGEEKARGKCTEKSPGQLECSGDGPPATPEDCEAARKAFKIPDEVIMLFDPNGKMWSSNGWFGPKGYSNGMLITNSELKITTGFPVSGQGPPGPAGVELAISEATDK